MADTRAVLRNIEAGLEAKCPRSGGGCGQEVKFLARIPSRFRRRVVANIYWFGEWDRVETYHLWPCYIRLGMPFGRPSELHDEDLDIMTSVLVDNDPWLTPDTTLMDLLIAQYRAQKANLNIATV